jgi:hypothetical protein
VRKKRYEVLKEYVEDSMMRRVKRVLKSTLTPRIRRAGEERSDVVVGPDYGAVLTNVQDQQVVGNCEREYVPELCQENHPSQTRGQAVSYKKITMKNNSVSLP